MIFKWDHGPDGKRCTLEHDKYEKQAYISVWHLDSLAKMCLLTGGILTYAYGVEHYIAWYLFLLLVDFGWVTLKGG